MNGASTRFAGKGKVAWLMMICPPTPASAIPVTCRVTSPSYTTFPWCFVALDTLPQCTPMRTRKPSYVPQTRRVPAVASCTSAGHAAAIRSSCTWRHQAKASSTAWKATTKASPRTKSSYPKCRRMLRRNTSSCVAITPSFITSPIPAAPIVSHSSLDPSMSVSTRTTKSVGGPRRFRPFTTTSTSESRNTASVPSSAAVAMDSGSNRPSARTGLREQRPKDSPGSGFAQIISLPSLGSGSQSASRSHVPSHSSRRASSTRAPATMLTPASRKSRFARPEPVAGSEPKYDPGASNTPRDPAATRIERGAKSGGVEPPFSFSFVSGSGSSSSPLVFRPRSHRLRTRSARVSLTT